MILLPLVSASAVLVGILAYHRKQSRKQVRRLNENKLAAHRYDRPEFEESQR